MEPEKREANKTKNTQRQGPGHLGPETKESRRKRARADDGNGKKTRTKTGAT